MLCIIVLTPISFYTFDVLLQCWAQLKSNLKNNIIVNSKIIFRSALLPLWGGVILRFALPDTTFPIIMISIGGTLKLLYIASNIKDKSYVPGKEFGFLIGGLIIFFSGIFLKNSGSEYGIPMMVVGLLSKILFIRLFMKSKKRLLASQSLQ